MALTSFSGYTPLTRMDKRADALFQIYSLDFYCGFRMLRSEVPWFQRFSITTSEGQQNGAPNKMPQI